MVKRLLLITAVLTVLTASITGWLIWRKLRPNYGPSITAIGGREMSVKLPELGRTYLQKDPQWRNELLGQTKETLGNIGCTVCSVAMASTSLGSPINPSELNQKLGANSGFTGDGWLVWGALPQVTDQKIEVTVLSRPAHADIDAALSRGEFPVVKFFLPFGIPHWVVIVGKDGLDYLIRDPAQASEHPIKLSSRTKAIYSVRVVRRKEGVNGRD
jgi:hypothetical protein